MGHDTNPWSRAFGGWTATSGSNPAHDEFDDLCAAADSCGVQWRDLVQRGYHVPGDLRTGGVTVSYNWRWRADELRRRIEIKTDEAS